MNESTTIRFVGLDVHRDSIAIAVASSDGKPAESLGTVPNDIPGLKVPGREGGGVRLVGSPRVACRGIKYDDDSYPPTVITDPLPTAVFVDKWWEVGIVTRAEGPGAPFPDEVWVEKAPAHPTQAPPHRSRRRRCSSGTRTRRRCVRCPAKADVVVLGAGPAGLSASIGLAGRGLQVRLVTLATGRGRPRRGEPVAGGGAPAPRLGVWDAFVADDHSPCFANASAWGGGELRHHDFLRDPRGHAWHIDRRRFERRLAERAEAVGVASVSVARAPRCEWTGGRWRVRTGRFTPTRPRHASSSMRRADRPGLVGDAGPLRIGGDAQVAAVAFLETRGRPIEDTTSLVEAVERGWWYSAALPDGRLVAAFMTDHDLLPPGATIPEVWPSLLDGAAHTARRLAEGGYRRHRPPGSWRPRAAGWSRWRGRAGPPSATRRCATIPSPRTA